MHTLPLHKISYVKIETDSDTRSNRLPSCLATKGPTDSGGILARSLRSAPAYENALYNWLNFGKTKEITKEFDPENILHNCELPAQKIPGVVLRMMTVRTSLLKATASRASSSRGNCIRKRMLHLQIELCFHCHLTSFPPNAFFALGRLSPKTTMPARSPSRYSTIRSSPFCSGASDLSR